MNEINHECYVSLDTAKLLKKAGFDWECRGYFDGIEFHPNGSVECTNYNSNACKYLKVPTLDVAQRWLREKTDYQVDVACVYINHKRLYSYSFYKGEYKNEILKEEFLTYEGAQEAGIKKALEIILEKGEWGYGI